MKNIKWLLAAILTAILLPAMPAYNVEASQNQDGFLFDGPDSNNQVTITGYEGTGGDVTVPDKLNGYTVWNIGLRAFENKSNLTSITLPDSISDMDPYVFSGCTNLEHVKLPDSLTRIPPNTFENCTNLKSIQLPEKLRNIGESAFRNCSSLTQIKIPNGVTQIKENAFYSCGQMKSIVIPASVTSIAWNAFQYCNSLDTIQIDDGNATYDSRNNCNAIIQKENHTLFIGCIGTTIPDSVAAIGEKAFYHCEGLTSIAIPASVKSIGKLAFSGCSGLTQLTLAEGVTGIGESAFVNCSALTNMMIPASVHEIGSSAFVNCTSLADVTIGDGVGTIGDRAFLGCNKLKSITIPASVQTIGNRAFGYKDDHADSNSNFIIHSDSGSAAEEYAKSNGITVQPIPAAKKDLSSATVTLEKSSYVYSQTACTPTVTVTLGGETLTRGTDYSVSYSNNTQPGTAKVTVTGKGQYMGSKTISFTITEASGTPDPDQQQSDQQRPGQEQPDQQRPEQQQPDQQQPDQQHPTASITCPKTVYKAAYGAKPFRIKASADGSLTWKSSNKKIAAVDKKGKVTIKGTGVAVITVRSGSASVEVTVRVSPKKPAVSSAKAAKGRKLTVKWKKDKRATGYQVQLSFTKTFKKIEKKLDTKKNACTFKKLKTGKAYYVRIRSYKKSGREKVYSAWSKPKKGGKIKK